MGSWCVPSHGALQAALDLTDGSHACLQLGAVAERLGGVGKIMHGYNGLQPSVDAVRWMNFDEAHVQTIVNFPLAEISFLGQEIPPPPEPKPDADAMETDVNSEVKTEVKIEAETDGEKAEKTNEGGEEKKKEWVPLSPIEARRRRVEGGHRASMSFRGEGSVRQPRPTVATAHPLPISPLVCSLVSVCERGLRACVSERVRRCVRGSDDGFGSLAPSPSQVEDIQKELGEGFDSLVTATPSLCLTSHSTNPTPTRPLFGHSFPRDPCS
eukprot:3732557-Rhodomonas_salina.1